ncbi:MAG: thiamine phosphate synthase, partial [Bacteroidota bacterium]
MDDFGLYVIISNPQLPYREMAEICVRNEVEMLQLREKHLSDRELLKVAREIREITRNTGTNFVINDRPDIALLCDADFLHLGQEDLPIEEARKIVGANMGIGLSTHSLSQAREALQKNPHYIGFGPIYSTTTKENPDPTVGPEPLSEVLQFSQVPVVAIGGIFPDTLEPVLKAGARNVAVVRYLMNTTELEDRIRY